MNKYKCTYYVRMKYTATVEAESEDDALDYIAEGREVDDEREVDAQFDEDTDWIAELIGEAPDAE